MICPKKVQDVCLFGMDCPLENEVDDNSECADYIRSVLALMNAKVAPQEEWGDQVEAAELQQEREAIQEEPALRLEWTKAPLLCRIGHLVGTESPSALFYGCRLGRRRIFAMDCTLCPEYRGMRPSAAIRRDDKCR